MSLTALPRRLVAGITLGGGLVLACLGLPPILSPPEPDAVHAALLPPGTTATVLKIDDGRVLVAPRVRRKDATYLVGTGTRTRVVAAQHVVDRGSHCFVLGSDRYGRDLLYELVAGGRISLAVAGLSAGVALLLGSCIGLAAATAGRVVDALLMRLLDALLAFPLLFLMILLSALIRPSPAVLVLVLGLSSWMGLARLVRGQVLSLRTRPFVLAATISGSSWRRIWQLHYLPHLVGPVSQDTALRLADLVIAEATLSYLGLGVPVTMPTWGSLVAQGHTVMLDGWWLATFPGLAIATLVIALALVSDGLQQLSVGT